MAIAEQIYQKQQLLQSLLHNLEEPASHYCSDKDTNQTVLHRSRPSSGYTHKESIARKATVAPIIPIHLVTKKKR